MELYFVQHGEAKPETEDPERPLTERGAEAVRRMAAWANQGFQQAGIVCLSREDGKWAVNWVMPPELLDRKDRP